MLLSQVGGRRKAIQIAQGDIQKDRLRPKRLTELDQLMQARNIPVLSYSVNLEKPRMEDGTPQDGTIYLSDYPADQIGAENLPQVLEAYQKERSKEIELDKEKERY